MGACQALEFTTEFMHSLTRLSASDQRRILRALVRLNNSIRMSGINRFTYIN